MAYLDLAALKKSIELTGETFADDDLRLALSSASEAVDSYCGRKFTLDDEETTRFYKARRHQWIEIDDLAVPSSIESNGSASSTWQLWDELDWEWEPLNGAADNVPYQAVRLTPTSQVVLEPNMTTVAVTGTFGWPTLPDPVKEATSILASRLLKRVREAPFGIAGVGVDGVGIRISTVDPDVRMLLSPYSRNMRLA